MKYSLEEDRSYFEAQYLLPQAAGGQAVLNCLIGEVPRYRPGDAETSATDDRACSFRLMFHVPAVHSRVITVRVHT